MTRWNQETSDIGDNYSFSMEFETAATSQVSFGIEGSFKECIARFLGCIVIGTMPKQGLSEAMESLRCIWNFYTEEDKREIKPQLTIPRVHTDVVRQEKRPDLVLS